MNSFIPSKLNWKEKYIGRTKHKNYNFYYIKQGNYIEVFEVHNIFVFNTKISDNYNIDLLKQKRCC
jgi:hypothetical protein